MKQDVSCKRLLIIDSRHLDKRLRKDGRIQDFLSALGSLLEMLQYACARLYPEGQKAMVSLVSIMRQAWKVSWTEKTMNSQS